MIERFPEVLREHKAVTRRPWPRSSGASPNPGLLLFPTARNPDVGRGPGVRDMARRRGGYR